MGKYLYRYKKLESNLYDCETILGNGVTCRQKGEYRLIHMLDAQIQILKCNLHFNEFVKKAIVQPQIEKVTKEPIEPKESLWFTKVPSYGGYYWQRLRSDIYSKHQSDTSLRLVEFANVEGNAFRSLTTATCGWIDESKTDFTKHYEWAGPITAPEG